MAEDADDAWIEESLAFDAQVGAEDRRLIERVQAGMGAGFIEDGRLLPESEQLIAHFQALVVDALASARRPKCRRLVNVPPACGSA